MQIEAAPLHRAFPVREGGALDAEDELPVFQRDGAVVRARPEHGGAEFVVRARGLVRGREARALGLEDLQRVAALRVDEQTSFGRGPVIAFDAAVGALDVRGHEGPGAREIGRRGERGGGDCGQHHAGDLLVRVLLLSVENISVTMPSPERNSRFSHRFRA